jgi:hypothetical protein
MWNFREILIQFKKLIKVTLNFQQSIKLDSFTNEWFTITSQVKMPNLK